MCHSTEQETLYILYKKQNKKEQQLAFHNTFITATSLVFSSGYCQKNKVVQTQSESGEEKAKT